MARAQHSSVGAPTPGGTIIGPDIRVLGRVTGQEDLHVQGRIDGAISLSETLYVAPGGIVAAEVDAHNVVVSGVIVGNVTARDCVTLHAGAKLVGDINAPRLVVADGATFKGNVRMGGEAPAPSVSRQAARARTLPQLQRRVATPERAPVAERVAPPRRATPVPRAEAPRAARAAAVPEAVDDEPTVIVRHAALAGDGKDAPPREGESTGSVARFRGVQATRTDARSRDAAAAPPAAAKKKLPARARIPKPGKRRVNRR